MYPTAFGQMEEPPAVLEALAKLLPVAIVGAFLPTWTSHVIVLLATKRPIANGLAFVVGNMTFRLALGVTVLFIGRTPIVVQATESADAADGTLVLVGALLMLSLAYWLWRRPHKAEESLPGWMRALESVRPWMSFVYGFVLVAMPGVQYVYFASGLSVIAEVEDATKMLVLLAAFVVSLQVMLLAPTLIFARKRDRAEQTLLSLKAWLTSNGQKATAALIGLVGLVALYLGIRNLLG